jgi:TPR repeat protein
MLTVRLGYPKAEYAVGYFTEMGIGCRRDPLEANVWYVKAADHGDQRAKNRLVAIQDAASGGSVVPGRKVNGSRENGEKKKSMFAGRRAS